MATQDPTCTIDGCTNKLRSRGWCITHYSRWRKHGDPNIIGVRKPPPFTPKACSLVECARPSLAKGLCSTHYERQRRTGSAGSGLITAAKRVITDGRKLCGRCGEWKLLHDFNKSRHGTGGVTSMCRECQTLNSAQWRAANPGYWREWMELNRARSIASSHNRRARLRGVPFEFIDRDVVFQRDGFMCMLCNSPLDMEAKFPNVLSPSLDHVIPLSKGGPHLYTNIQSAHFGCNSGKCDRILD